MAADRRERAKSIRAARDWLTGAEHALAGEDDLAGDLKLMLARAELARIVADRRARMRRLARWLLPTLAAAAVLAYFVWDMSSAEETVSPPPAQRAQRHVDAPAFAADTVERAAPLTETPPTAAAPPKEAPAPSVEHAQPQAETAATPSVPAPVQSAAPAQRRQMPDADMQRLMQVGGKILRE